MPSLVSERRLPGIRFEDRSAEQPALLPRMDIAVFVGFAACGPLHVPVPIEDLARFTDVFGPDLELARDPATGSVRRAHLAAVVRGFFANGGRRCWVVRVADEVEAETARIGLAGVLQVSATGTLSPALAVARSAGAWSDALDVRCFLATRGVTLASVTLSGSTIETLAFAGSLQRDVTTGDVVRLQSHRPGEQGLLGFARLGNRDGASGDASRFAVTAETWFADAGTLALPEGTLVVTGFQSMQPGPEGPGMEAMPDCIGTLTQETPGSAPGSPRQLQLTLETDEHPEALRAQWLQLRDRTHGPRFCAWMFVREAEADEHSTGVVRLDGDVWCQRESVDARLLADPGAWLAEIVTLDLQTDQPERVPNRDARSAPRRLRDLGFAPEHPRAWVALPSDDARFLGETQSPPPVLPALWAEADAPRFALAGPGQRPSASSGDWYVPLGLDLLGANATVWHSARAPIERDGLARFVPELFLDPALAWSGVESLAGEAEFIRHGLGSGPARSLRGLHAAWPIEEATLIAVPDAVHSAWERDLALPAPPPAVLAPEPRPVRAGFLDCDWPAPPAAPELAEVDVPQRTFSLRWTHGDEPSVCFVLEEARAADWSDARVIWIGTPKEGAPPGAAIEHVVRGRATGNYYYRVFALIPGVAQPQLSGVALIEAAGRWYAQTLRVRPAASESTTSVSERPCAIPEFERSDWSNGIVVRVAAPPDWQELPARDYDPHTWLAVSLALARLCAARGDALSLLALPAHARADAALELQAQLLGSQLIGSSGRARAGRTLASSDSVAFGYAALYHPWLVTSDEGGALQTVPPVGAVAGSFAGRALDRGAWIAPANQPLVGVVALAPPVEPVRRQEFLTRQLNLLRSEPTGFLALSQDTLALDPDAADSPLRPVNVRRLMILLRRLVLRLGEPLVFEPNDENLRIRVRQRFGSVLARLQARGAFAGRTAAESYRVECGDELNPPYAADAGRLVVQIKVAPSRPLTFLTIRLVQNAERSQVVEIA